MDGFTEEKERAVRRQTIDSLRMHFVYNAINAIRYYIRNNPDAAYVMTGDLATFLRGNVENALEQELIPLGQELQFARAYARLEYYQRDMLEVKWNVTMVDGYVFGGSVYGVIMRFVKTYIVNCPEKRTIVVENGTDGEFVQISIPEVGAVEEVRIQSGGSEHEDYIG